MKRVLEKMTVEQYGKIRFAKDFIRQKSLDERCSLGKRVWFLDAPDYGNMGDQAIAYATQMLCRDVFGENAVIEFQESNVICYLLWIKKHISSEDIIVLQGGGNMGNLYPRYEFIRRTIIKLFPENRIVIFPQSIAYSNDLLGQKDSEDAAKIYGRHSKLIVFARDSQSFKEMKQLYHKTDVRLCPDIVFMLTGAVNSEQRNGIGLCMRDDKERTVSDNELSNLIDLMKGKYTEVKEFDTAIVSAKPIMGELRKQLVIEKLKEFAGCEMVITDRLHGMVFSYVSSTPCIALANSTGKSKNAYNDWLKDKPNVTFVQDDSGSSRLPEHVDSIELNFDSLIEVLTS